MGYVRFGVNTSPYYRDNIEFVFFNYHLKEKGDGKFPAAWTFETGTNLWRTFDAWPPKAAQSKKLYLHAGGKLSFDAPQESDGAEDYLSDPSKPVPYVGFVTPGMTGSYMTSDQRFASKRPDVLTFETDVLEEDLTVAGPVSPELFVSTTGTDSDFVVKLIDVYPGDYPNPSPNPTQVQMGGYQQLVCGEPFRGKFRNSFEKPEAFTPNKRERIAFAMPDVLHTFRRGHRIMVQVQSSWFPLIDRNPQKFVNIPDAKAGDFQKATQRVYRSKGAASNLQVSILR